MIDAETEPAEIPIKKADHVVPPTGSTSWDAYTLEQFVEA
jgi:hypothetical protein